MSKISSKKNSKSLPHKKVSSFIKRVQNTAHKHVLWNKDDSIIVGISGGPDSTCLLDVLVQMRDKCSFALYAAHINYGLRGKDADLDETYVRNIAEKWNVELFVTHPKSLSKSPSEETMRKIRYDFFEKVRLETRSKSIAVGHNKNDQAETVLLHLLRGSSLNGIGAIRPYNNKVIRPLLETDRASIIKYLEARAITYRMDLTNYGDVYARNKIRNSLIPSIEKDYNPAIINTLARFADTASQDYAFIHALALKKSAFTKLSATKIQLSVLDFLKLHTSLRRETFRIICFELNQSLTNVHLSHYDECLKIFTSHKNKAQTCSFEGLKLVRRGDTVTITKLKK